MRSSDEERFTRLHARIESRLRSQLRDQRVPLARRIQRQALLSVVRKISDIKTIVIFALQNVAKLGRNTYPAFLIDRVVESAAEHPRPPRCPTTSHSTPLQSSKSRIPRCHKLSINSISQ